MSKSKLHSKTIFSFKSNTLLKDLIRHCFCKKKTFTNPIEFQKNRTKMIMNYKFNFINPKSFNEYLVWLLVNYRNSLWEKCADKLKMKNFLVENGFGDYAVKTIGGPYKTSSDINLNDLPDEFVLKTNHDSGSVYICKKGVTDFKKVFDQLDRSLSTNYSKSGGEWVYEHIEPVIFAEEVLKPAQGKELIDYKFFSFNGVFGWGFAAQNRNVDTRFTVFEKNFEIQNVEYIYRKPSKKNYPPKPLNYDKMVKIAETISKILDFVRVDFYDTNDGPKIGELTFFSQCGTGVFTKKKYDFKYGHLFENTHFFSLIKNQ